MPFSFAAALASSIIRATESLGLRGGPSLLRLLSGLGLGKTSVSTVPIGCGRTICFPSVDPYWAPYLWAGRSYEPDVEAIFRSLAPVPNKILVDCGANIGFWTVRLSEPEFGFRRFIAVEPNPRLGPFLARNIEMNRIDCTIVPKAIAEDAGKVVLLGGTEHHAVASIADHGVAVRTTSLAELVPAESDDGLTVVVKLDVEGSEIAAVKGIRRSSRADFLLVYEDWPRSGFPVTDYLLGAGYCILGVAPGKSARRIGSLEQASHFNLETNARYGPSNLLACLPGTFDRFSSLFGL